MCADLTRPGQSDFIRELLRLNSAQVTASTPDEREAADDDLAHFLRLNGQGRLQEWFDSKAAQARNDA